MNVAPIFFTFAVVLMAPHMLESEAKLLSVICLFIGVVFWIIEWITK
jgi:hypothetical protein